MKVYLAILVLSQILTSVFSVCPANSCNPATQVYDAKSCSCVDKVDCLYPDPIECSYLDCAIDSNLCPQKCLCSKPSAQNNYCTPCQNNGELDLNTCKCTCKAGFQGPQCQFPSAQCGAADNVYCSKVNCWNATYEEYFSCPIKCMCCLNKACKNLGQISYESGACKCKCFEYGPLMADGSSVYDEANGCEIKANGCKDHDLCNVQVFPTADNCLLDFVRGMCPLSCKVCKL